VLPVFKLWAADVEGRAFEIAEENIRVSGKKLSARVAHWGAAIAAAA
jgi:hypothetical protein